MNKKLSIIYCTARKQPKFEWFVEYIVKEYNGNVTDEIIFVDIFLYFDQSRREYLNKIVNDRFDYIHLEPKPSMWYGHHKKTKTNFFDASSTRNSGLIVCSGEHIVFIDDLSIPMPGWISYHKKAAEDDVVLAGLYDKVYDIEIEDNIVSGFRLHDSIIDGRVNYTENDYIKIPSGWCFTGNLSVPYHFIEKINGFDELYARHGNEDCDFGVRLEHAGASIFLEKKCKLFEDQYLHWNGENEYTRTIGGYNLHRGYKSTIEKHLKFFNEKWPDKIFYENGIIDTMNKKTITPKIAIDLKSEREYYKLNKKFKPLSNILEFDYDGEPINEI